MSQKRYTQVLGAVKDLDLEKLVAAGKRYHANLHVQEVVEITDEEYDEEGEEHTTGVGQFDENYSH